MNVLPPQAVNVPQQVEEPEGKKSKRDKWTKAQTNILVAMWKENLSDIESSKANVIWTKIKTEVDKHGTVKTIKQCKIKIRNLKDTFKKAKENNKKSGCEAQFPEYYDIFGDAVGHRDAVQLPKAAEVGTKEDPDIDESLEKQGEDCESDEKDNIEVSPGSNATRKRKNLHKEEKDQLDEDDEDTEFMLKLEQEKQTKDSKKTKKTKESSKSFYEQIVDLEKQQLAAFKESEQRQQNLILTIIEKQNETEEKERQKDREFFLQLGQLFSK